MARNLGLPILLTGLVLLLVCVLADVLGVGQSSGFGADQIKGSVVGAVLLVIGFLLMRRNPGAEGTGG